MRSPAQAFLILFCLIAFFPLQGQRKIHSPLDDDIINTLEDWRDLGGAQKISGNKNWHRSLIRKINQYERYDSLSLVKWVDSLASLKIDHGFHFLTDLCCRYIDYSRNNQLTRMAWILNRYGGPQALNKYYLNDSIPPRPEDPVTFHAEAYHAMRNKYIHYMNFSWYMKRPEKPIPPAPLPAAILKELASRPTCDSALLITPISVNEIQSPWQLFGLNQALSSPTDSLVDALMNLPREMDSTPIAELVHKLVAQKSEASLCLVYALLFNNLIIEDLNPFNQLAATLNAYGAYHALNHHYLQDRVETSLPFPEFASEVRRCMLEFQAQCYYCKPKTSDQIQISEMKKIPIRKQERKIIAIIRKNRNLKKFGGFLNHTTATDRILQQVLALEGISDAGFDNCRTKILLYPGWITLGVIVQDERIAVQKCYPIQLGQTRNFSLFGRPQRWLIRPGSTDKLVVRRKWSYYKPGFVQEERNYCEETQKELNN